MSSPLITTQNMRSKLLPLDQVRETLATTEPLSTVTFSIGEGVRFRVQPGWQHGLVLKAGTDPIDAYVTVGPTEFQLTKDALLEATSICGLPKVYAGRCPAELLEPQLNFWWRDGLKGRTIRDYQLLIAGGRGAAITRASVQPFSNLRLLEEIVDGIEARYGRGEILADYKLTHTLRRTHLRLIVPEQRRTIQRSGTAHDDWSVGAQVINSLVGEERTSVNGYLFRWTCTNGATDTMHDSGTWTRRGTARDEDIYEWARSAVDDILGGLESSLDAVQAMVDVPIDGQATQVLADVFEHYRVPTVEQNKIISNLVDAGGQLTMYSIMAAVTEVANQDGLEPSHVDNLLRMGGDLPHAATSRCDACRRLLPH